MKDRTHKILKWLRITWTATWGVVAVLFVVLWVRNYWVADHVGRGKSASSKNNCDLN